jgi:hypothetical protein
MVPPPGQLQMNFQTDPSLLANTQEYMLTPDMQNAVRIIPELIFPF